MSGVKPSSNEEEYFAREDAEKKRQMVLNRNKALAHDEQEALKKLHFMHCPRCGMELSELSLRGVVVDKCFNCHGVFLGEDELEKLAGHEGYWARMLRFFARKDYHAASDEP